MPIRWNDDADNNLRSPWGGGSASTQKRARRTQRELKLAASQSYSIASLFERQQHLRLHTKDAISDAHGGKDIIPRACSPPPAQNKPVSNSEEAQRTAAAKLDRLLLLPTEQKKMYGSAMDPRSSFYLRHRMVQSFLWLQLRRSQFPSKTRRELACITAHSFKRGLHTGRMIIKWAKSWVRDQKIPNTNAGRHKHHFTWMDDEDVVFAVRSFIRQQGESEYTVLSIGYYLLTIL
jgi:hypothetical protein